MASHFEALLSTDDDLARVWASLPRRKLVKGEHLFEAGERTLAVWRLDQGLLRLFYTASNGCERTRSFHVEGHWVGSGVPLESTPSAFSAEALEPTVVVELSLTQLKYLEAHSPRVRAELFETLGRVFDDNARREASLLGSAEARYLAFLEASPALARRVSLQHLARYLGITDVALSRIRRRLGLTQKRKDP